MDRQVNEIENQIRTFIHAVLEAAHGDRYWKSSIPGDIKSKVADRITDLLRKKPYLSTKEYAPPQRKIQFCDVPDYTKILLNKKNWQQFGRFIARRDHLEFYLSAFSDFRNAVKHNREMDPLSRNQGQHAVEWLETHLTLWLADVGPTQPIEVPEASGSAVPEEGREEPPGPDPDASDALSNPKYGKVLKRLRAFYRAENAEQVLAIDPEGFAGRKGVGKLYVSTLRELQAALRSPSADLPLEQEKVVDDRAPRKPPAEKYTINWTKIQKPHRFALRKLERHLGREATLRDLLRVDLRELSRGSGVGRTTIDGLVQLREQAEEALANHSAEPVGVPAPGLLVPHGSRELSPSEVEDLLITDVGEFMAVEEELTGAVMRARWGYGEEHRTLEELGTTLDLTRERVRQLEAKGQERFKRSLRVPPKVLWDNVGSHIDSDLQALLPRLRRRFKSPRRFLEFIEMATSQRPATLTEKQLNRGISRSLLEEFFADHASPVPVELVIDYLAEHHSRSGVQAHHYLSDLSKTGQIAVTPEGLSPRKMAKKESAICHVLAGRPEGWHWKRIAKEVNRLGVSRRRIAEDRLDGAFTRSNRVVLVGRGTYVHSMHLPVTEQDVREVLLEVRGYLAGTDQRSLNLQEIYPHLRSELAYHLVRHIVRDYGDDYGIHGRWKSTVDTISMDADVRSVPTSEYVLKLIEKADEPLSTTQITDKLRAKSTGWAKVLLSALVSGGEIVEVERGRYTTSARAAGRAGWPQGAAPNTEGERGIGGA